MPQENQLRQELSSLYRKMESIQQEIEKIDLARIYAQIWKDAAPAHVVDVAVFCDSDDAHTASIRYFEYVRLERR